MSLINLYLQYLLFVTFLWMLVAWVHGMMKTEALSMNGLSKFIRNFALLSLQMTMFPWLFAISSPIFIGLHPFGIGKEHFEAVLGAVYPWIIGILITNIATGILNLLLLRSYSMKRWGTSNPQYNDWEEFDGHAHHGSSSTVIWFNNNSLSPVHRTQNESLANRANSNAHRSSDSDMGSVHRTTVVPFMMPTPNRSPASKLGSTHRSSGSSKKSSGGSGGAEAGGGCIVALLSMLKAIIGFIVQLIIILALAAVAVFFVWLSIWAPERITDWFDELWVVEVYADPS